MKRHFNIIFALFTVIIFLTVSFISCDDGEKNNTSTDTTPFDIKSPYATVDWSSFGQYKGSTHAHTNNSDGSATLLESVNRHYELGFDILPITDHIWKREGNASSGPTLYDDRLTTDYLGQTWKGVSVFSWLTQERIDEITAGEGRDGRGMLLIPNSAEWAFTDAEELNTFFYRMNDSAPVTIGAWKTDIAAGIKHINDNGDGAIFFINHPGRTTGAQNFNQTGADLPNNPSNMNNWISKYANLYIRYPITTLTGMEIFNRRDQDSRHDRVLWDNVLKRLVPQGRFVWGYGGDDSHSVNGININYNMFIMPSNTHENWKAAMINGHSYIVTCIALNEGVDYSTPATANVIQPRISSIIVDNTAETITITAKNVSKVVWISEGKTIWTDQNAEWTADNVVSTLDLMEDSINSQVGSYVRANLIGTNGMAVIQPIGTKKNK